MGLVHPAAFTREMYELFGLYLGPACVQETKPGHVEIIDDEAFFVFEEVDKPWLLNWDRSKDSHMEIYHVLN